MNILKRMLAIIISLIICLMTLVSAAPAQEVTAASKTIKVDAFIKHLVTELKLPVDKTSKTRYIDAAMKAGILKKNDFKDYSVELTRADCAVLANRADKYLNGYHGYPQEVYELLKDMKYFNGRLFYNLKGSHYPKGKDQYEYPASQFLKEVIEPILRLSFKFSVALRPAYTMVLDDKGDVVNDYFVLALSDGTPTGYSPFSEDDKLVQAWHKIIDEERKVSAVYEKRISDINKISRAKRQDVAEVVAKGIIKGFSNGRYIQNRAFRGGNKITASGAKNVVSLVLNPSKRAKISPDGQLIRTTKLPKNADKFPYILECFPNDFYEMKFEFEFWESFKQGTKDRESYKYPYEIMEYHKKHIRPFLSLELKPYEYYDTMVEKAEQYVTNVFNVDYRTVNKKWIENVASSYAKFDGISIYDSLDEYVKAIKKNKVIVESQTISVEPSTMYHDIPYYIRVYVKYRITADTFQVKNQSDLIFGTYYNTYLVGLKKGEWTFGYYDIAIGSANSSKLGYLEFGVAPYVGISDFSYKGKH